MEPRERKAAVAAYKQRKIVPGVYAVYCTATGKRWVGRALDLSTVQNRIWFTLRHGASSFRSLQTVWNELGADCFVFEQLEQLEDDLLPLARDRILKERVAHWREQFHAEAI